MHLGAKLAKQFGITKLFLIKYIFIKNKSIYNQFFLHKLSQIYLPI